MTEPEPLRSKPERGESHSLLGTTSQLNGVYPGVDSAAMTRRGSRLLVPLMVLLPMAPACAVGTSDDGALIFGDDDAGGSDDGGPSNGNSSSDAPWRSETGFGGSGGGSGGSGGGSGGSGGGSGGGTSAGSSGS